MTPRDPRPLLPLARALGRVGLVLGVGLGATLSAQNGDQPGEPQPPLPESLAVPAAPVLSPTEALAGFRLPDDLVVELVASEPLVVDPVAVSFDARGRLWVVEMRGFMPDVDGTDEQAPVGRIAVLSDTNGDGRMDARAEFLDELRLPRAVHPTRDGALIIAPPELIFARDTDGDGRADLREVVDTGLGGLISPEHAPNALLGLLDNSVGCANHDRRYVFRDGEWVAQRSVAAGQWGLTQDDLGRLFFNTNSDPLRAHLFDPALALRSPGQRGPPGLNIGLVEDKRTWPARMTPGVNRGYRRGTLREDYTLASVTAACAPWIYRGVGLPADYHGDAFVCEPAGNLVQRYRIEELPDGGLRAENPHAGELDVLTSTDERFRPVQLSGGPDGALYVVDMYRGILQHRIFLTSWLRAQILDRALDRPVGMGRIWRVRAKREGDADGTDVAPAPPTTRGPPTRVRSGAIALEELVAQLSHPGGWQRDRAQQALVEEYAGSPEALGAVREVALSADSALGRVHALWTLEGWGLSTPGPVLAARRHADPRVRHTAWRLLARQLARRPGVIDELLPLSPEPDPRVQLERLFALGAVATPVGRDAALDALLQDIDSERNRGALLSGLAGRQLEAVDAVLADARWSRRSTGTERFLSQLAEGVGRDARTSAVNALLDRALSSPASAAWQREALVEGLLAARPKTPLGEPGRLRLAEAPEVAAVLLAARAIGAAPIDDANQGDGATRLAELAGMLHWPGHPEPLPGLVIRPLDAEESARFARGHKLYAAACASCHQVSGRGEPGKAPPLQGSAWVLGPPERLVRILLHGLQGELEREGRRWDLEMPSVPLGDSSLAALLTYLRREWGHGAEPVDAAAVAAERKLTRERDEPWTVAELEALGEN